MSEDLLHETWSLVAQNALSNLRCVSEMGGVASGIGEIVSVAGGARRAGDGGVGGCVGGSCRLPCVVREGGDIWILRTYRVVDLRLCGVGTRHLRCSPCIDEGIEEIK